MLRGRHHRGIRGGLQGIPVIDEPVVLGDQASGKEHHQGEHDRRERNHVRLPPVREPPSPSKRQHHGKPAEPGDHREVGEVDEQPQLAAHWEAEEVDDLPVHCQIGPDVPDRAPAAMAAMQRFTGRSSCLRMRHATHASTMGMTSQVQARGERARHEGGVSAERAVVVHHEQAQPRRPAYEAGDELSVGRRPSAPHQAPAPRRTSRCRRFARE